MALTTSAVQTGYGNCVLHTVVSIHHRYLDGLTHLIVYSWRDNLQRQLQGAQPYRVLHYEVSPIITPTAQGELDAAEKWLIANAIADFPNAVQV